jgi:hypothetical protein
MTRREKVERGERRSQSSGMLVERDQTTRPVRLARHIFVYVLRALEAMARRAMVRIATTYRL